MRNYILSLGWTDDGIRNNRQFFRFGSFGICMHLADDTVYLCDSEGNVKYDFELDASDIKQLTDLIKALIDTIINSNDYTVKEFINIQNKLIQFYKNDN